MTIYPWSQNVSLSCIQCVTCCSLSHRPRRAPSVLFLQILVSIVGKIECGGSRADWLIIQQCGSFLHILHDVRHEKFQTVTKKLYSTQHYNRSGDPKTQNGYMLSFLSTVASCR